MDFTISNLITKAARVVTRDYQRECAPYCITPSQAGVVFILNMIGPSTQVEIAAALHLEKTNINAMVKKLTAAGLVEIKKIHKDCRKCHVFLTEEGQKLVIKLNQVDQKVAAKYFELADSPEQAREVVEYLKKIVFPEKK